MPHLTATEAAAVAGGRVTGESARGAAGFVDDSRMAGPGSAFVAVNTGHDHVAEALQAGAPYAVVEREGSVPQGGCAVVVDDMLVALAALASWWRERLQARVLAVTGSTGKTTTKDFIAAAAGARFAVHAAPRSYNNEVGLPLTILGCPGEAEVLVCEIAARHGGEVGELARIARPHVAVVTGIGVAHLGEFGSREAIASTKAELVESLDPDGVAVLPSTDDYLAVLTGRCRGRVVTVGHGGTAAPKSVALTADGRPEAVLELASGERVQVRVPLPGRPLVRNAAMAVVAAAQVGVPPSDAARALQDAPTSRGRMTVSVCGGRLLVNDAYNANPTSAMAALRTVAELARGRPAWAVLAQMAELGPIAHEQHLRLGRLASALGFERVVAVGPQAADIGDGAGAVGVRVPDADAARALAAQCPSDAIVLVKGSLVAGLQRVAESLRAAWAGGSEEVA